MNNTIIASRFPLLLYTKPSPAVVCLSHHHYRIPNCSHRWHSSNKQSRDFFNDAGKELPRFIREEPSKHITYLCVDDEKQKKKSFCTMIMICKSNSSHCVLDVVDVIMVDLSCHPTRDPPSMTQ